jgi:hypothetical protein
MGKAGGFGSPYRAPAGGWPAKRKFAKGSCFQHRKAAEDGIPEWQNVTVVADFKLPGDPNYSAGGVPVFPRYDDGAGWPDGLACPDEVCIGSAGYQPCGPWLHDDRATCATPDTTHATVDANCYLKGGTLDLSQCRKGPGFKNVQAQKWWHGRFGYRSHDFYGSQGRASWFPLSDDTCTHEHEPEQTTAETTKYLKQVVVLSYDLDEQDNGNGPGTHYIATITRSMEVGRYTGLRNPAGSSDSGSAASILVAMAYLGAEYAGVGMNLDATFGGKIWEKIADYWSTFGADITVDWSRSTDGSGNTVLRGDATHTLHGSAGYAEWCPETGSATAQFYAVDDTATWVLSYTETFTCSDTSWTFTREGESWGSYHYVFDISMTGTLSVAYTEADLEDDVVELLAEWDLADDVVYPWRHDEWTTIAPLVTRREYPAAVVPGVESDVDWEEPFEGLPEYDGSVKGAPGPGTDRHFDYDHETYGSCVDDDEQPVAFRTWWGAWANELPASAGVNFNVADPTDLAMPPAATQWRQNWQGTWPSAGEIPSEGGGFWHKGGLMFAQKWAQIKVPRRSHNFARPCGEDRWALDEPKVRCVSSTSGDPVQVTLESDVVVADGTKCLVCGLGGVDGVWEVTRISAGVYELTTFVGAAPAREDCGSGIFGPLRWPTAPAICGRVRVVASSGSGPVTMTVSEPTQLVTGDQVVINGGTYTATVVSAVQFSVVSYAGNPVGQWVTSPGAAAYQWHDNQGKGDFLYLNWTFNFRDHAERSRVNAEADAYPDCDNIGGGAEIRTSQTAWGMPQDVSGMGISQEGLAFDVCNPQVMAITPNGETWTNGVVKAFPTIKADDRYGARWWGKFYDGMQDPLWQEPHKPCVEGLETTCAWVIDQGACPADLCVEGVGVMYYPHWASIEARSDVPGGAPALPTGTTMHVLTLAELNTGTEPTGLVLPPPTGEGYVPPDGGLTAWLPVQVETDWGRWWRQVSCVCGEGQFASDYEAQGIKLRCP